MVGNETPDCSTSRKTISPELEIKQKVLFLVKYLPSKQVKRLTYSEGVQFRFAKRCLLKFKHLLS